MAINFTSAKPYAKAVFDLALSNDQIMVWKSVLEELALVSVECKKHGLLSDPKVGVEKKVAFFLEAASRLPAAMSLVELLAERKRLTLLPDIADCYQKLFLAHSKILEVRVVSACELSDMQKERLHGVLCQRYGGEILLHYCIDANLIGGAVISISDHIIDHSIKGMLLNLKQNLTFKEQLC